VRYARQMWRVGRWAGVCVLAAVPSPRIGAKPPEVVHGITVSTHTSGHEWGTDAMRPTLEKLKAMGSNWVAIHPYARISADGSVRFREIDPERPPEHLVRPIREAHAMGLNILIKPHLAYWRSPFPWRGDISFETEDQWRRFWHDYERWIVSVAAACRDADGFVVGTELDRTLGHEDAWRRLVGKVRQQTSAALTYAANWSDYQKVGFWDALDTIGIQAYFPLTSRSSPSSEEIRRGWAAQMARLRSFAESQRRRIVFTELGYSRSYDAPVRPWDDHTDGAGAEVLAQACLREALSAIEAEPRVVGAFLWKWFPEPRPLGRNFRLATPGMTQVIREAWAP
jgi:hypothetical protein